MPRFVVGYEAKGRPRLVNLDFVSTIHQHAVDARISCVVVSTPSGDATYEIAASVEELTKTLGAEPLATRTPDAAREAAKLHG